MKPDARDRCECTETIAVAARATTAATAEESRERLVALGSVMAKLPVGCLQSGNSERVRKLPEWAGSAGPRVRGIEWPVPAQGRRWHTRAAKDPGSTPLSWQVFRFEI